MATRHEIWLYSIKFRPFQLERQEDRQRNLQECHQIYHDPLVHLFEPIEIPPDSFPRWSFLIQKVRKGVCHPPLQCKWRTLARVKVMNQKLLNILQVQNGKNWKQDGYLDIVQSPVFSIHSLNKLIINYLHTNQLRLIYNMLGRITNLIQWKRKYLEEKLILICKISFWCSWFSARLIIVGKNF